MDGGTALLTLVVGVFRDLRGIVSKGTAKVLQFTVFIEKMLLPDLP